MTWSLLSFTGWEEQLILNWFHRINRERKKYSKAPRTIAYMCPRFSERRTGFDSEAAKHGGCWLDNPLEHLCLSAVITAVIYETGIINV